MNNMVLLSLLCCLVLVLGWGIVMNIQLESYTHMRTPTCIVRRSIDEDCRLRPLTGQDSLSLSRLVSVSVIDTMHAPSCTINYAPNACNYSEDTSDAINPSYEPHVPSFEPKFLGELLSC